MSAIKQEARVCVFEIPQNLRGTIAATNVAILDGAGAEHNPLSPLPLLVFPRIDVATNDLQTTTKVVVVAGERYSLAIAYAELGQSDDAWRTVGAHQ